VTHPQRDAEEIWHLDFTWFNLELEFTFRSVGSQISVQHINQNKTKKLKTIEKLITSKIVMFAQIFHDQFKAFSQSVTIHTLSPTLNS
jgi:hypothetical protein